MGSGYRIYKVIGASSTGLRFFLASLLVKKLLVGGGRVEKVKLVYLAYQFDDPPVGDPVIDKVGILAVVDDALVAQDIEMLGDVGVG